MAPSTGSIALKALDLDPQEIYSLHILEVICSGIGFSPTNFNFENLSVRSHISFLNHQSNDLSFYGLKLCINNKFINRIINNIRCE